MNNKGFAITTILYGVLILFCLLLVSLLGILSVYHNNMEKLIDGDKGTRSKIKIEKQILPDNKHFDDMDKRGLYCVKYVCEANEGCPPYECRYLPTK